ncbi:Panacea domain-containing protein [Marinospirillum insulare]|uniref:Antitoxin SocA-like Panacea domain-containing protein n=1 Tax=Marinospirillum insulare TaxID=217169 RepID=A0ABQ5ZW33_9GAMM|nr:type II toxin-antitoxin system antitoxin SocA domain-containing protein [Marinospirillum insulare]GLR64386.1 hypothetical protein GCM10007878_18240 [Marinospirillum insulare]
MKAYHTYSAIDVAYVLLEQAAKQGKQFTNLQIQKLVYVCHGVSLAHFDRPLILEDVHAWKYGPVVPSVYFNFKQYGADFISEHSEVQLDVASQKIVCQVIEVLGHYSGPQLVELTHRSGSPWHQVWNDNGFKIIPDEIIKNHYALIKESGFTNCL